MAPVDALSASPAPDSPQADPPSSAVCVAPGCGGPLTAAQVARGTQVCSPACRTAVHRVRRERDRQAAERTAVKVAALGALDRIAGEVERLRREIEGW